MRQQKEGVSSKDGAPSFAFIPAGASAAAVQGPCDDGTIAARLRGKIFIKVYLIENKEVILLIQLNW